MQYTRNVDNNTNSIIFHFLYYLAVQLLFSSIYRRREQVICFGLLVCTNNIGTSVGSLIGFGFINLNGVHGLSGWKWYRHTTNLFIFFSF